MRKLDTVSATVEHRPGRGVWVIGLSLIVVVAAALRLWGLGEQSLWFDEGYSAWVVTLSPGEIVEVIRNDVSPPLYYLLLRLWCGVFGDSESALRGMSALAGILAAPVTAAIAWRMTGRAAASMAAGLLMAVSVLQVQFAQEARSYGLASLLAAIWVYAAVRRMSGSRLWLVLMWAMAGAFVHLHNIMWFYLAGLCAAYLLMPGRVSARRRLGELAALNLAVIAVYAWWIPSLVRQVRWLNGNFWASSPTGSDLVSVLMACGGVKPMHLWAAMIGDAAWWIVVGAMLAICFAAMAGRSRDHLRWALAVLAFGAAPILAVFAYAQTSQSYFVEKVFAASTVAMPLLAGLTIVSRVRWVGVLAAAVVAGGSVISVHGYFGAEMKEDWRGAVAYVNGIEREGTVVVFVANEGELLYQYYLRRSGAMAHETAGVPQGFFELYPPRTIERVKSEADVEALEAKLEDRGPQRVVLVLSHTHFSDPQGLTRKMIEGRMKYLRTKKFNLVEVVEFERL